MPRNHGPEATEHMLERQSKSWGEITCQDGAGPRGIIAQDKSIETFLNTSCLQSFKTIFMNLHIDPENLCEHSQRINTGSGFKESMGWIMSTIIILKRIINLCKENSKSSRLVRWHPTQQVVITSQMEFWRESFQKGIVQMQFPWEHFCKGQI